MYKLMIVDDEPEIREHIKSIIAWQDLDLLLVAEVGDADTALENALLFHPQIVLMDICLPGQDGLSLAAKLIEQDEDIQILIISGFQDFAYAKKAIDIGVSNYLTKPIVPKEVNATLQRIVEGINIRRVEQQKLFAAKQVLEQNKSTLQKWQLESLLNGGTADLDQTHRQMQLLDLELGGDYCIVLMVSRQIQMETELDGGMQAATVKQYIETKLQEAGFRVHSFFDDNKVLNCLLSSPRCVTEENVESICKALRNEIKFYFGQGLNIGIGAVVINPTQISESAYQAKTALQHCIMISKDEVVSWQNIRESQLIAITANSTINRMWLPKVVDCIREGREKVLEETVEELCQQLQDQAALQEFGVEFLGEISRLCSELGVYPWKSIDYPSAIHQIFATTEPETFKQVLLELCGQLTILLTQRDNNTNRYLIIKAREYIEENYTNPDLSLEEVSNYVGLSRSYFCSLFHKIERKTFKIYLMELRIHHAKQMLVSTDKKIYEISGSVGCSDSAYFNRVFKRITGMTPLQFRNRNGKNRV